MTHRRALLQNAVVACIGGFAFVWGIAACPLIVLDALRARLVCR